MIIRTQSDWRRLPKPTFCYLCGELLANGRATNDDHCPPKRIFKKRDLANFPLILKTHKDCNDAWSLEDNRFATLWSKVNDDAKNAEAFHRIVNSTPIPGSQRDRLLHNVPLEKLHFRILRFMHATLYGEYIPDGTKVDFHMPFPRFHGKTFQRLSVSTQLYKDLSRQLVMSQSLEVIDGAVSHNGMFKYVCTWDNLNDANDVCIYAMDINDMRRLSPTGFNGIQVIVGCYFLPRPPNAPKAPRALMDYPEGIIRYPIFL